MATKQTTDKSPTAVDEAKQEALAKGESKPGQHAEVSNLDTVRHYFDRAVERAPRGGRAVVGEEDAAHGAQSRSASAMVM